MKKFHKQRVALLVDAENLEITAYKEFNARIDYKKLIDAIDDREIVRAIYYSKQEKFQAAHGDGPNKFDVFFDFLRNTLGFEIRGSPKNADCFLTVDAIAIASKVDVLVLVGGDSDYLPLIWYLKSQGVRTEVWMFEVATAQVIQEAADVFVPLDNTFFRY